MFAGVTTASSAIQENQQAIVNPVTGIPNALAKRCNRICIRKTWHTIGFIEKMSHSIAKQYRKDAAQHVVADTFKTLLASGANEFTTGAHDPSRSGFH